MGTGNPEGTARRADVVFDDSTRALEAELERLASLIADGVPLGPPDDDTGARVDRRADAGLRLIERVAQEFRHGAARAIPGSEPPLFRFAGLDVVGKLGAGSYGEVWRAFDPVLDHWVALKLRRSDSEQVSRALLDEARCLAQLRHPNILRVYGAAVDGGRVGLWTELVHGETLQDLPTRHGVLTADEVRQIGRELCAALACIHRHGLIHGDVKPENIMREDSGRVILMDFGAARTLTRRDRDAASYGSLRYLAPETLRGAPPSPQADLYALGVTLFRLLTSRHPYPAEDLQSLLRAHDRDEPLRLRALKPDLPADLCAAIECAIAVDPARRHRSAHAFATALEPGRETVAPRSRWWFAALAFAAAAVAVATRVALLPAPWSANAEFYLADNAGYRLLRDGEGLKLGDAFALEFYSTRPVRLYVIDEDGTQAPSLLFPSADLIAANPVSANGPLWLPGRSRAGMVSDWQVSRDAKRERVTVIAATRPIAALDAAIVGWREVADRGAGPAGTLRGVGALVPARAGDATTTPVDSVVADLRLQGRNAVRVWQFVFPHADHHGAD